MVVAIVALCAVALLVANFVGAVKLRGYLTDRVDDQLDRMSHAPYRPDDDRRPPPQLPEGYGDKIAVRYYSSTGALVKSQGDDGALGSFADLASHVGKHAYTVDGWRIQVAVDHNGMYSVAAISMDQVDATVNQLLTIGLGAAGLVLVLLAITASAVVRLGLGPLTRMEEAASAIAGGDLGRRAPDADPHTEPGRLGLAMNAMLGRIQRALAARAASEQRLRQFLADASHELRTPLTSIRGFAELYRRGGVPPGPELDEMMRRIEDEAARMGLLVNDLLLLASLDEERPLERHPVDLLEIAADAVRDAHVRAPDRVVRLASFDPVTVEGDEARLRQVTTNLLTNALHHTPPYAKVVVRVSRGGRSDRATVPLAAVGTVLPAGEPTAVIEVTDTGPGVAVEQASRIFERLYRADPSRTRGGGGGSGLGLSIVAAIVTAHGGRVELLGGPGQGATFRVILPRTAPHSLPLPTPSGL
ncbi:MAG TPA: HAMP domain-containing sensor histidine kinase [Micromonosporaceae bacterium]|jgi:two-component system OmpR family sensor kinase|nr:HAMP domain-containing sensor histidine kinase [Micromonosporaceae bacterium]